MSTSKNRNDEQTNEQRRKKQISDRREDVTDARSYLAEARLQHQIRDEDALQMLRQAVENYLLELEQIIKLSETETDYWGGVDLGSIRLPDGSVHQFTGLQSIVDCPNPIVVEWTESNESLVGGSTVERRRDEVYIPEKTLLAAYRTANAFIAEYGLELDEQKENVVAEGEYEDIHLTGPPKGDPAGKARGDD